MNQYQFRHNRKGRIRTAIARVLWPLSIVGAVIDLTIKSGKPINLVVPIIFVAVGALARLYYLENRRG